MVNKEKNDILQITMPKDMYQLLKKEAKSRGLSAAAYSRMVIIKELKEHAGRR